MGKKKVYHIEGLHCANCALKIERELNNLKYVDEAIVNAVTSKAILDMKTEINSDLVLEDVEYIASSIEHGVTVKEISEEQLGKTTLDFSNIHNKTSLASEEHSHNHDEEESEHHHHHHDHHKSSTVIRLIIGVLFGISGLFFNDYVSISLFLIAYVIVGGDILLTAFHNILKGKIFDENFLMSIATIGAFLIGAYPEAIGVMLFYQVGEYLQDLAVNKSKKSIASLMNIRPDYANIERDNGEIEVVSPEEVEIDDIIIIKPGEKIPLDGVVISGESQVDTSSLTGESTPKIIRKRDSVLAGSINKTALLEVRVTNKYSESTVSKILELVENASNKKAPTEKFISRFARIYTPIVVALAFIIAIVPPIVYNELFSVWVYRALSFLVVSCPCALVISVPLSFFGGIGGASKVGVLIKVGNYLEALSKAYIVVFDKTGTLTEGTFEVNKIESRGIITEDMILEYAAYAEMYSNHPIAKSIIEAYKKSTERALLDKSRIKSYEELPGKGVKIYLGDRYIYAGNYKYMEELGIRYIKSKEVGTIVYLAVNDNFVGSLVIADKIKATAPSSIQKLREIGIKKIIMFTGDNRQIASYVGQVLNIEETYSELLPHEKVSKLEAIKLAHKKSKVLFVGDGINDAPVLTSADIGIAMGGVGSDAAIEASDVVLMTDDPTQISTAISIARKTEKIVLQNIIFSISIKVLVLVLTALGLTNMWMAVFADVGVTIIAVLNSIRALKIE